MTAGVIRCSPETNPELLGRSAARFEAMIWSSAATLMGNPKTLNDTASGRSDS